jgi:glycine/D-amino acid oxidase-like deaminating enzyme
MKTPDIVIVGGGVMGCALAYFLGLRGAAARAIVVERDPTYAKASSALSASGIRQQYSTAINIALSRFGVAFLRDMGRLLEVDGDAPSAGLREGGYLYLASEAGRAALEANHRLQRSEGVDVALLDPLALQARFPWLSTEGIVLGSLGLSGEGWFDGYGLLQALKRKAKALGVTFVTDEVVGLEVDGRRVRAARLASGTTLSCDVLVNAAGPHARRIAEMAGAPLPVEARRRTVFVLSCPEALPGCPLVIDPSGIWFRPEGNQFLAGFSPPGEDAETFDLEIEHEMFEALVWPALAERVPAFERLRVAGAWAGHYEYNTLDQNGLVGPHPDVPNMLLANGFSGHGLQQSPAVGRALSELILDGRYATIDLAPLSPARFSEGRPLVERNVI